MKDVKNILETLQKDGINCHIKDGKLIIESAINMQGYKILNSQQIEVKKISYDDHYASVELSFLTKLYSTLANLAPEEAGKILYHDLQIARGIMIQNNKLSGGYLMLSSLMLDNICNNIDSGQEYKDKFVNAYAKEAKEDRYE